MNKKTTFLVIFTLPITLCSGLGSAIGTGKPALVVSGLTADHFRPYYIQGRAAEAFKAYKSRRYNKVLKLLKSSQAIPDCALRARTLRKLKRWNSAVAEIQKLITLDPLLIDHYRTTLAQLYYDNKKYKEAMAQANLVKTGSIHHRRALYILANSQLKSRAIALAVTTLEELVKGSTYQTYGFAARKLLAENALKVGKKAQAIKALKQIWIDYPLSREASRARKRLKKLTRKRQPFTVQERLRQASSLTALHRSWMAIRKLRPIIRRYKPSTPAGCRANFLAGVCYSKLRRLWQSRRNLDRAARHCPDERTRARALFIGGRVEMRAFRWKSAISRFSQAAKNPAAGTLSDDALLYMAKIYNKRGKLIKAAQVLRRQLKDYPKGDMAHGARWLMARIFIGDKNWTPAIIALKKMIEHSPAHDRDKPLYWLGLAYKKFGRHQKARELWNRLLEAYPASYYSALARGRLKKFKKAEFPKALTPFSWPVPDPALLKAPGFRRGAELLRRGLDSLAAREFSALKWGRKSETKPLFGYLYHLAGNHVQAVKNLRYHGQTQLGERPKLDNLEMWKVAYPLAYEGLIRKNARRYRIPPLLLFALVREESGFEAKVESWANAYGLAQIIYPTARRMARALKIRNFRKGMLLNPAINLRIGAAYLKDLLRKFGGDVCLAIAGYNAGHKNVFRWLRRFGRLPREEFVEQITFQQTRNYVKRVIHSYAIYRYLYASGKEKYLKLSPRLKRRRR